jgi:glutamate dehydrogenase
MTWMYDEYSRIREYVSPNFITGKPLVLGGSAGCEKATALSVCVAAREAARTRNQEIE